MSTSELEKEVEEVLGLSQKKKEDRQDFLLRIATDKVTDEKWEDLSDELQDWIDDATKAYNNDEEIDDFPDFEGDDDGDGDSGAADDSDNDDDRDSGRGGRADDDDGDEGGGRGRGRGSDRGRDRDNDRDREGDDDRGSGRSRGKETSASDDDRGGRERADDRRSRDRGTGDRDRGDDDGGRGRGSDRGRDRASDSRGRGDDDGERGGRAGRSRDNDRDGDDGKADKNKGRTGRSSVKEPEPEEDEAPVLTAAVIKEIRTAVIKTPAATADAVHKKLKDPDSATKEQVAEIRTAARETIKLLQDLGKIKVKIV